MVNVIDKIDYIIKFFQDPCDAPWTAYALAAGGAALELFVSVYSFDFSDIFWSATGEITGLNKRRSGRKGRRGRKSFRGFDPNENIGKQIGKWVKPIYAPAPVGLGFLWVGLGILQRLNNFIFFAGALAQFFYRWTSLIMESKYCAALGDSVLLKQGKYYVLPAIFPWTDILVPVVVKQRGVIGHRGGIVTFPAGGTKILLGSADWKPRRGRKRQKVVMRIVHLNTGQIMTEQSQETFDGTGGRFGVELDVKRAGRYGVLIKVDVGFADIRNATLYAQYIPDKKKTEA